MNLSGFDLSGLDLTAARFVTSDLTGLSFASAVLVVAHFNLLDIASVDFAGANLANAPWLLALALPATGLAGEPLASPGYRVVGGFASGTGLIPRAPA